MSAHTEHKRLLSLDVFRGITVAGMIVVNSPGNDDWYRWVAHSPWNGLTPADLVFPSFLVIMGYSLTLSFRRRRESGHGQGELLLKALRRALIIMGFGLLSSFIMFKSRSWPDFRLPGVLQRISLCYFFSSVLYLEAPESLPWIAAGLLLLYWALMRLVSVPGHGAGDLSPAGNLASYLDRRLLGGHLIEPLQDPEGLLSTVGAVASTLIGVILGRHAAPDDLKEKGTIVRLATAGAGLAAAGALWGLVFPVNKHLWTSSYALLSGGAALLGFAGCCAVVEVEGLTAWTRPFEIVGRNPLIGYFSSEALYGLQEFLPAPPGSADGNLKLWFTHHLFSPWLPPRAASLAYALSFMLFCMGILWVFHRRKIYIKV